jgi:hypothetical protein
MSLGFEPLSWLTLERYVLDELAPEERARVEAQLQSSVADRACLQTILQDQSELPPLARPTPRGAATRRARKRESLPWLAAGFATAAAIALGWLRGPELPPSRRIVASGEKGGEVALTVYGEQHGEAARVFTQGERFKLLVTCPSDFRESLEVLVFQDGRRYQPLGSARPATCGNRVPWPGAFALDGTAPAVVCVTWGEHASHVRAVSELTETAVCTELTPAR